MPDPGRTAADAAPFARGSIALGLHVATGVDAAAQAAAIVEQAQAAERAGFSGVTISEHHGDFPGYMGMPCLASNWVLAATERVWAGPAPYLLNLRNPVLAAEELAWSNARFPGRFCAAFAPGYSRSDFELIGVPFERRGARFEELLATVLETLESRGPGAADPAFEHWRRSPAPVACAANSKVGVRRAARFGLSLFFPSGESHGRMRELIEIYREAGGTGTISKIRPVWLGEPPAGAIEKRAAMYKAAAEKGSRQAAGFAEPFLYGDPEHVAEQLARDVELIPLDGLNVRLHLEGVEPGRVLEQIGRFGETVMPRLAEPQPGR